VANTPLIRRPFRYTQSNISLILIGINVFVFFLTQVAPNLASYLGMNPVLTVRELFVWQPLTYMFVHGGVTHVLFNMLALFFFGPQLEYRIGSWEFLTFYLVVGFLAGLISLGFYLLTGTTRVLLVGASGAIFGILLAFASYFPGSTIYIFGLIPVPAPILVLVFAGISLFSAVRGGGGNVAHLTHLAGFAAAYLYLVVRLGVNPFRVFFGNERH
jgi:membrane associated rhomboid family serine protease